MANTRAAGKRIIGQHSLCRQRTVFRGSEPHERRQLIVVSYATYAQKRKTHAKEAQCLGRTSANRDPRSALHRSLQKRYRAFACLETTEEEPGRPWASRRGGRREEAEVRKTVGAIAWSHAMGAVMFRLCCRRVLAKVAPVDQACGGLDLLRRTAT